MNCLYIVILKFLILSRISFGKAYNTLVWATLDAEFVNNSLVGVSKASILRSILRVVLFLVWQHLLLKHPILMLQIFFCYLIRSTCDE